MLYNTLRQIFLKWLYNGCGAGDVFGHYRTIRKLGLLEQMTTVFQNHFFLLQTVHALHVTGAVDVDILRKAMCLLQIRHPSLRCGVHRGEDDEYYFHEYTNPEAILMLDVVDDSTDNSEYWIEVTERYNNTYRSTDSHNSLLWRLVFVRNTANPNGMHHLIVVGTHCIIDGTSRSLLSRDLLMCYSLAAQGRSDVPIERSDLHPPMEALFSPQFGNKDLTWRQRVFPKWLRFTAYLLTELVCGGRYRLKMPYAPVAVRRDRLLVVDMNSDEVSKLIRATKARGIKLHGVLTALHIVAFQRVFRVPKSRDIIWQCPVRCRPWSKEPIDDLVADTASYVDGHHRVPDGNDDVEALWLLAQSIEESIHENLAVEAYRNLHDSDSWNVLAAIRNLLFKDKDECGRVANISVSNLGNCSHLPRSYSFKDATTADAHTLELHGWHAMQGQRALGPDIFTLLASFHGKMYISLVYTEPLFSREQMIEFSNELRRLWNLVSTP